MQNQTLDRRISALESHAIPVELLTIIRKIIDPCQLTADIQRVSANGGESWTRLPGETEQGFLDRTIAEVKRNEWGAARLCACPTP